MKERKGRSMQLGGLFGSKKLREERQAKAPDASEKSAAVVSTFEEELASLINKYSLESLSNTPDFILAFYVKDCLIAFNNAQARRKEWFSVREEKKKERESQMSPLEN